MELPDGIQDSIASMIEDQSHYTDLLRLYNGDFSGYLTAMSTVEERQLREVAKRWKINFCRSVVDTPLEKIKISGILCADDKARTVLDDFWTDNKMDAESKKAHEKALIYGRSYVTALPDETMPSGVSAYAHGPGSVKVFYDPVHPRRKSHAIHVYEFLSSEEYPDLQRGQRYLSIVVYYNDVIQRYVSVAPLPRGISSDYTRVDMRLDEEVPEPVPNTIPVFDIDLKRSRLIDAEGPQLMSTECLVAMTSAIRAAGWKQRWISHEREQAITDRLGGVQSSTEEGVNISRHIAGVDNILEFEGKNVQLGVFDPSQADNFVVAIDALLAWMSRVTDLPSSYFSRTSQPQTGESFRESARPLNDVVMSTEELLGPVWSELYDYVLALSDISAKASPAWAPPNQNNDKDYWDAASIKVNELGVPIPAVLIESGLYDQQTIDTWREDGYLQKPSEKAVAVAPINVVESIQGKEPDFTA